MLDYLNSVLGNLKIRTGFSSVAVKIGETKKLTLGFKFCFYCRRNYQFKKCCFRYDSFVENASEVHWRPGLRPQPTLESPQRSPTPTSLAELQSKGKGGGGDGLDALGDLKEILDLDSGPESRWQLHQVLYGNSCRCPVTELLQSCSSSFPYCKLFRYRTSMIHVTLEACARSFCRLDSLHGNQMYLLAQACNVTRAQNC